MTALIVVLAVVAVLAALLAAAARPCDALVRARAERHASEYVSAPLGTPAHVRVLGSSFLNQAIRGRYGDIEVRADGLRVGALGETTLHAHLFDAHLPLRDLLGRRVRELPVARVHGELVIPYDELARVSSLPIRFRFRDGRLRASASVPIPGISSLARVSGDAVTSIDGAGEVWLRVRNLSVAGVSVPTQVLNQLMPVLAFQIPLPALPYGLRLEQLTPAADGLRVTGSASSVVFRADR